MAHHPAAAEQKQPGEPGDVGGGATAEGLPADVAGDGVRRRNNNGSVKSNIIEYATVDRKGAFSCCAKNRTRPAEGHPATAQAQLGAGRRTGPPSARRRSGSARLRSPRAGRPAAATTSAKLPRALTQQPPGAGAPLPAAQEAAAAAGAAAGGAAAKKGGQQGKQSTANIGSPHFQRNRTVSSDVEAHGAEGHGNGLCPGTRRPSARRRRLTWGSWVCHGPGTSLAHFRYNKCYGTLFSLTTGAICSKLMVNLKQTQKCPPTTRRNARRRDLRLHSESLRIAAPRSVEGNHRESESLQVNRGSQVKNGCTSNREHPAGQDGRGDGQLAGQTGQVAAQCSAAQVHGGGRFISEEKFQKCFIQNGYNSEAASEAYFNRYPERRQPNMSIFGRLKENLVEYGGFNKPRPKNYRIQDAEDVAINVVGMVVVNPSISSRQIEAESGISRRRALSVLKKHKFRPYTIRKQQQILQLILNADWISAI
ncbi:hypothetical protein NQ318_000126, partial [Aromia moschata]